MKLSSISVGCLALWAGLSSWGAVTWEKPEMISTGVQVMRGAASDPRPIRVNAVKIDLKTANVGFTGTGRAPGNVYGTPLDEAKTIYNSKQEKIEPADKRVVRKEVAGFFAASASTEKGGRALDMLVAFNSIPSQNPYSGAGARTSSPPTA